MPEPAKPREPQSTAPSQDDENAAPFRQEKQNAPVIWPRDMNTARARSPDWGTDPEGLRDA